MLNDRKTIGAFVYELNRQTGTATILPKKRVYRCQFKPGNYKGDVVVPAQVTYRRKTYTVTAIGAELFSGCKRLTSVVIPETVTAIHHSAFQCCTGLRHVEIPDGVTHIGNYTFKGCLNLTSVRLPQGLTKIENYAFYECRALTSITIPEHIREIAVNAFRKCYTLKEIVVDKRNRVYDSRDYCNAIIDTKTQTLVTGCMNSKIPVSVPYIGESAFEDCENMRAIKIPESVKSIGNRAFACCVNLRSVHIPKSVENIRKQAFQGCAQLLRIEVHKENKVYDSRGDCNALIHTRSNTLLRGSRNTIYFGYREG